MYRRRHNYNVYAVDDDTWVSDGQAQVAVLQFLGGFLYSRSFRHLMTSVNSLLSMRCGAPPWCLMVYGPLHGRRRQQPITSSTIYGLAAAGAVIAKRDPDESGDPLPACDMTANAVSRRIIRTSPHCMHADRLGGLPTNCCRNCVSAERCSGGGSADCTVTTPPDGPGTPVRCGILYSRSEGHIMTWSDMTWRSLYTLSLRQTSRRAQWS